MNNGSPDVVKQVIDELVDRVDISHDKQALPYFRVPNENRPGPLLARACGTPVRTGPHHVEVSGLEPPTSTLRTAYRASPDPRAGRILRDDASANCHPHSAHGAIERQTEAEYATVGGHLPIPRLRRRRHAYDSGGQLLTARGAPV